MKEAVLTKYDLCRGCNRCVRECPMETANITYQDENGSIKVKIDYEKCITCGRCISACKHNARYYIDGTEHFFNDLSNGVPISLMAAPSIRTNIPEYKKLFTCLKQLGVNKIYDVSLGADICIWAHIRHLEKTNFSPLITQPCPAIVKYCKIYHHDLLKNLSPVHSPMGCTSIYMKKYESIADNIAALSPCIAKSHEFEDTGIAHYNVTFSRLNEYLLNKNIKLPQEETEFDNAESGIGLLFPMPGGLKENIEFFCGKKISIDRAEGYNVYEKLNAYIETPNKSLPHVFDVLNCDEGCNIGTACSLKTNSFIINRTMDKNRGMAIQGRDKAYFDSVLKMFDDKFDLSKFYIEYGTLPFKLPQINEKGIEEAFKLLGKNDYEQQNIDCGACGSQTCRNMARKIALGVNIPINCIVKSMEDAKKEHEENIIAHQNLVNMEKLRKADELNEFQLAKINMVIKATKIGLWDMEVRREDPMNVQNIFNWSDEFRHLLGFEDENDFPNLLGSFTAQLHPDDLDRVNESFEKHMFDISGKTPYDVEYRAYTKNGECRYFHASGETIRDEYGNPLRVAGALMDITEEKNTLIETQRLRDEAEAANKAKSAFLSTMSHEIRTPMNAILGITEIQLQNEMLDEATREAFEKIYTSGDMLLGIINDILDLSKIEAGRMELLDDKYEIASLLSDTVQLNMMRIGSKPIEFKLHVDENLPLLVSGDELRVKQILNNLLSNAFKYTKKGSVKMSVTAESSPRRNNREDGKVVVVFSIKDTGQGMTEEQVGKLFDEYSRFNLNANRTTEGTGLGMTITRNLVRMMNGSIDIKSKPGKGSVFTVRLPQGKAGNEVLGRELADSLQKFRSNSRAQMKRVQITREPMPYGSVLIVDDVEINIYVAKGLLLPYKLKIDSANSGYAAIEKIKSGAVFDIIFMDHMMPEMDGIETTKILRSMGYDRPIVALTANAVSGQAEIFIGNGFDDFISKPIDVRQLNTVLNKLIRDKQPPEAIEEAGKQAEEQKGSQTQDAGLLFNEIFVRDASRSIKALEEIVQKKGKYTGDDMRKYIIHVHGMKSALANFGRIDLCAVALKLETSAREGNKKIISSQTPAFIKSLKELVNELMPKEEITDCPISDEDRKYLHERLTAVKEACDRFDESTAEEIVAELKKKTQLPMIKELLSTISEHLLHSDFDKAADTVNDFLSNEPPRGKPRGIKPD